MYLMIDNYDSFVYNLVSYVRELGQEIILRRNDKITIDEIINLNPRGIIISPGPKSPVNSGMSEEIVKFFSGRIPILGVCLGHQVIGHVFGAAIVKGTTPMHGKVTSITHNQNSIFHNLPRSYYVTRYHSLVIDPETIPEEFWIDAVDDYGTIMAISHKSMPVYGVQFHPEAVLSEYGYELLDNYIKICEKWWLKHE